MRHFQLNWNLLSAFVINIIKSNQANFLRLGNNLHFLCFKKSSKSTLQTHAILILFEKPTCMITYTNQTINLSAHLDGNKKKKPSK